MTKESICKRCNLVAADGKCSDPEQRKATAFMSIITGCVNFIDEDEAQALSDDADREMGDDRHMY